MNGHREGRSPRLFSLRHREDENRDSDESEKNPNDGFKPRLPKTPKERKELADIAERQGPKAVYAWIYGADSVMTQMVPVNSWKEAGMTPAEGLRQVLEGIQKMQR